MVDAKLPFSEDLDVTLKAKKKYLNLLI